jgi:hypothetical protein
MTNLIYFVNLDDILICHNLAFTKVAISSSLTHKTTLQRIHPVYTIEPEKMLTDINAFKDSFISPRLTYVMLSCWHRNNYKIGIGLEDTKWFSEGNVEKINKLAETEIAFEKVRRLVNSSLPTRLTCIYLAEDNLEGRTMLQNMFPSKKNFRIVPIKIRFCDKIHKADSKWISNYELTGDFLSIENYWKGLQFDDQPQFEYLLDGQIELADSEDSEYIKQYGTLK